MRQTKYYEAYLDDFNKIVVYLSKHSYEGQSSQFFLRNSLGIITELNIQSIEHTQQNFQKFTLHVDKQLVIGEEYEVLHQHARATTLEYAYVVKQPLFDELFAYDGNDLGACFHDEGTDFTLWAPTAFRVKVEVNKNGLVETHEMVRHEKGVFRVHVEGNLENATYLYFVRVNGEWKESLDPYGIAATPNSKRSVIIDQSKLKCKGYELPIMNHVGDAILYEASIRDFTIQPESGVHYRGKFLGFVEENADTLKDNTGFTYLKSLGITHVQLMPVLDFGSVDELHQGMFYNWGYDPVQYFCLEGSYAVDAGNPYSRIFEFIKVVEECHKAGIRVNLDVVYNHVYDIEHMSLNQIVPYYYFQMNEGGELSNGSFCGNDLDSTRLMCRKLIVDSCLFLAKTYKIDGLRFDLMGILDCDTLNHVYDLCSRVNKDFMVYGEGWDMPSLLDASKRASMPNESKMPHVAHFSDRFRDVVKGRTATSEAGVKGYVSGAYYLIENMKNVLMGSVNDQGDSAMFSEPSHVINYVECHDNMTSWDKLKECCKEDPREVRILRHEMLIASVLLAQGIPFIHSGQEFARNKYQLGNTYEDKDHINKIDYARRNRYQKVVECTKTLINLRKRFSCFRYKSTREINEYVSFETIDNKLLMYRMKDEENDVIVIFNPSETAYSYTFEQDYHLLYDNGMQFGQHTLDIVFLPYHTYIVSANR